MILSTLCYIEKDDKYLMLHRTKKKNDINKDKWLGVGGKIEERESPEECVIREVKEETGLTLKNYQLRGIVTYVSNKWETEYMYVFTANEFEGIVNLLYKYSVYSDSFKKSREKICNPDFLRNSNACGCN